MTTRSSHRTMLSRTRVLVAVTVAAAVLAACGGSTSNSSDTTVPGTTTPPETTAVPTCDSSVPYTSGEGDYDTYRIPAVVRTGAGTVLAFAEGRRDGAADAGAIDTLLRRSADGGCTWGDIQVVSHSEGLNRNNPAVVVDPATDEVILLTLVRPDDATEAEIRGGDLPPERAMRIFQQTSDDDGETFTEPREITAQVKDPAWRWYAVGPGHGIVLEGGDHDGRIVFGANHSVAPPEGSEIHPGDNRLLAAHAIYSDDHGATWQIGFVQEETDGVINGNETTAAQLPDGTVYFNTRDQFGSAPGNRAAALSTDGGTTLTGPFIRVASLEQVPVVQASVLQPTGPAGTPLVFSAPADPDARRAMTLFTSTDGGATWHATRPISDAPAAYSDLVQLDDATLGLLYETGEDTENETITFLRVPVAELTDQPAG